jgi:chromosome segregation ATPase
LQEREDHIAGLNSEHRFAIDNVSRLEENIRQRDAEIVDYSQRVVEREIAAEQLREQMTNMKREHARIVDEQARKLQDMAASDNTAREQMEAMTKANAEADVALGTLKEQASALKDEVERLRRQVHELQQGSADKEVKIVQLTKQRSQDKEDIQGLNIALDSKQQELELVSASPHPLLCLWILILATVPVAQKEAWCQRHSWKHACSAIEDRTSSGFIGCNCYTRDSQTTVCALRYRKG